MPKFIFKKIKKSQFLGKSIFAVTKIVEFFLQNIDYLGEYLTDFSNYLH